ncbi:hypothetical protein K461DRAFT_126988 [Myriangium duriaei CBS 260.36]|uniref:HECT-type E3 ubiquitin transferase n=1 Tax=Myriangium duriaei CBS 260.36 TaxID=1168546 RepID=A0A9P4J391_9PEZI|nr:hypothetical protein K461DRAFT_126988 [Myriangium duriaei CBS 260.36]
MGRIKKSATDKHDMALSPYIADFVTQTTTVSLHKIPAHVAAFPQIWTFPRGDLYHWIPVLNRFDHILELFVAEYSLGNGPQAKKFGSALLQRGDGDKDDEITSEVLAQEGFSAEGDRELVQSILRFSLTLLEHNGNRSLYSSSEHLNSLLNTTSLPLLKANLQLCLGLAQRYWSSKSRMTSSHNLGALLQSHYNINLDKIQAICDPLAKTSKPYSHYDAISGKSTQKDSVAPDACSPSDLNLFLKSKDLSEGVRQAIGDIHITFYDRASTTESGLPQGATNASPSSPTPVRRTPASGSGANIIESPNADRHERASNHDVSNGPKTLQISGTDVVDSSAETFMRDNLDKLPTDYQYELLQQVRIAQGFRGAKQDLQDLLCIRMYALANLSYVYGENTFHTRIGQADNEQPRDFQSANQLADLLQPNSDGTETVPLEISIAAVTALEALSKVKSKTTDVASALNISVSHGILFYILRKVIAGLDSNDVDAEQFRWREAVFTLVTSVAAPPHSFHRNTDQMVAAGLIGVLIQGLTLRSTNTEPHYGNILHFFDTFIHNGVRDSFQSLISVRGLEIIADLTSYEVSSSLEAVAAGQGLPEDYKTKVTDYQIPFYKQQALRRIVKFIQNLFNHNVGGGERHLRNLIDSPQLLGALKSIIGNAKVFGSNVWIGAVNIISSFVHSEPTSYNVIHEAGLSSGILEAIAPSNAEGIPSPDGVLPVGETLRDIPPAFGAICLNESGKALFQKSHVLDAFFGIFTSLDHVKVMEDDGDCAISIGTSFDELVRHHPELRDQVHEAVMRMMRAVVSHCRDRARDQGVGAKLWVPGESDNTIYVAGGRQATAGSSFDSTPDLDEVIEPLPEKDVETDNLISGHTSGKSTSDVISVISKFLQGYVSNNTMLTRFCETGGIAYLLDLAMCPCNPWNFHDLSTYDEVARVFLQIVESKPHMVLPSLVSRTKQALLFLRPMLDQSAKQDSPVQPYFEPWTSFSSKRPSEDAKRLQTGTHVVKGLVAVQTLINLLADIFQSQVYYQQRSTYPNYFNQINLTDYYVLLVDALGRLHTACIWEEIQLQSNMPAEWREATKVKGTGFNNAEADMVMGQITAVDNSNRTERAADQANNTSDDQTQGAESSSNQATPRDVEKSTEHPAAFRNTEILRYLFSQIPTGVLYFFQQLGKSLFSKSRGVLDIYGKQNATLVAQHLAKALIAQLQFPTEKVLPGPVECARYEIVVLSSIVKIMIDKRTLRNGQPDILLVVLNQFYHHGGFKELNKSLEKWISIKRANNKHADTTGIIDCATAGASMILNFYAKITGSKAIHDSLQASSLGAQTSDPSSPSYLDGSQLLVELRDAVVIPVVDIWGDKHDGAGETAAACMDSDCIRSVISVLRSTLEAEGEHRAFTRDTLRPQIVAPRRRWRLRNDESLQSLVQSLAEGGATQELAIEALFRCHEGLNMAREYIRVRQSQGSEASERLPPPAEELEDIREGHHAMSSSSLSQSLPDLETAALDRVPSVEMQDADGSDQPRDDTDDPMWDVDASTGSGTANTMLNNLASRTSGSLYIDPDTGREARETISELPDQSQPQSDSGEPRPRAVTKEDLDEKRKLVREDLVDRCLEFLNEHPDLTFDIADLITSATSSRDPESKELKESFGETLALTLVSLHSSDDASRQHRKIAAVAHLLALILQDQDFFDASIESLKNNFDEFVQLLKISPETNLEEATEYIVNILLVLERVLVEDEQPPQIPWTGPSADGAQDQSPIQLPPPLIEQQLKENLFSAILDLLPRVGKNEIFALSITRVLVILTRRRILAKRLSEKQNLGRLFLMLKQLAGMTNEKLQASFMIVLRHMVEDEQIIREIMRTEVPLAFENTRSSRPQDTLTYLRNVYHLVIRDPEIFVEVTNEKVKIVRFENSPTRPPTLALKKDEQASESTEEKEKPAEEAVQSTEQPLEASRAPLERTKTSEMKPPTIENPDGVIQFLMKELSSYRDVEDKEIASLQRTQSSEQAATPDVEMMDTATPEPDGPALATPPLAPPKSNERSAFKTEEHPIFTYRCHLLQCLVELLSSYNRTKVEFINFSPKNDLFANTPSKPRSGFLNYLLTSLIPMGTLAHAEDVALRKKLATSNWATSVIVALCTKTHERPAKTSGTGADATLEDESDLVYVRKFVLEQSLKAFNSAMHSTEPLDTRYSRLLGLSELFNRMLTSKANGVNNAHGSEMVVTSAKQLGRLMYEKNFVSALTASIAEIDLNFPNARRAVKYILRPLQWLTSVAVELSLSSESTLPDTTDDDEISSATSVSEDEDQRHATPDIFRNSTLGQFEAGREEESDSSEEDDEDEEDYYGDEYDEDGMEYEDDRPMPDHGDVVSDEDEEISGMGPIEGVPGDVNMDVEIVMDGDSEDGSDSDSEDDDDDQDDDDDGDDDVEILDEISGDDENDSGAEHDHDEEDWVDDDEDEDQFDDDDGGVPPGVMAVLQGSHDDEESGMGGRRRPLDALARVIGGHDESSNLMARLESAGIPMDAEIEGEFFDDEMAPEDDDEGEDYDEEIVYQPEADFDDEDDMGDGGWGWSDSAPAPFFRNHHHSTRIPPDPWNSRDPAEPYSTLRSHRGTGAGRADDGVNPLLQRGDSRSIPGMRNDRAWSDMLFAEYTGTRMPNRGLSRSSHMPSFMADLLQMVGPSGSHARVNIITDGDAFSGGLPPFLLGGGPGHLRSARPGNLSTIFRGLRPHDGPLPTRPPTHDPGQAVSFVPCLTISRWQDEARILFGQNSADKSIRVMNSILKLLFPAAVEAKRQHDQVEKERKAALEAERKRLEEVKRKEEEEAARKEQEEREAREAEEAAQRQQHAETQDEPETNAPMEGIEETQAAVETSTSVAEPAVPSERITAMVRGSEVDITNLGIDPAFLEEIPEDLREDVIMQQLQSRVTQSSEAAQASQPPDEIDRDFLGMLPTHIQHELLRAEQSQRSRRDREARRAARTEDQAPQAEEMNNADFMAMLDPALRQSVLMEADEEILNSLPDEFRAEAQALFGDGARIPRMHVSGRSRENRQQAEQQQQQLQIQRQRRPVVQILDKAGVATLMRLMFVALQGSARAAMLAILSDICKNTQTRAEVISILLSILQDGSSDSIALDKSFTQLTVRAKQLTGPKTPQPLRRTLTGPHVLTPSTDASPLTIVQQSLNAISALAQDNPRIATFFLTEHETISSQRAKTPKKGKSKEAKAHRYPVNALLSLLDRRTIMENASAIESLATLLVRITEPLKNLIRRAREEEKKDQTEVPKTGEAAEGVSSTQTPAENQQPEKQEVMEKADEKKKPRDAFPPEIPEENLCLVVNIIAARECSGKTFQNTLDIINHLSAIPGARDIFGRELVRRAQTLGAEVLEDLRQLPQQIQNAQTSTEMQGLALGAFSPAGSHQNKLLRILLALDYIFDPKRAQDRSNTVIAGSLPQKSKEDLVSSLYDNETFIKLWTMLSDCLTAIRERGTMNNVATILQPLVEAFMVVCKNTTPKEIPVTSPQEITSPTPPPQNRIESLFFNFTEEHRKILNDLVRQNPKLMSGTFDVLVKNSKVLEFDNKRNFFNKRLHTRSPEERVPHQSLQLGVRRSQVFLDSFKALFFKKPNEIKYGKLNIRFADEEGVDAGGVTREWFAALSRQMFDPNYALFNPVASDRTTFHPNPLSAINEQHLTFFKFIGRIIGKALYEGRVLDCHFSRAVYKRILGKSVSLKDMETLDLDYYKSLVWMLENDITDVAFETFSVDVDRFGETQVVDLIPDGRNVPVTEENKQEYVRLVVEQRLTKSVEEQLEHFLIGFREIVPLELISIFNEQELELLISGLPDIDVDDWRNNTDYHNYNATSPQVQWFWRAVRSFDKEEKAKLLQFVTGTSKVPLNGFKELEGMNGYNKFNIHRDFGHKERLPTSHTCFNQLDLPEYESYEILRKQMYTAMTVGSDYFGFA